MELDCSGRTVGDRGAVDPSVEVRPQGGGTQAFTGSPALEQARSAGRFIPVHDNRWAAVPSAHGDAGWTKTFTDPRLCAAIVDRFTFGGNIIQTGTKSYRLAHTEAQAARTQAD